MAFTPTTWVDGTTAITATQLNRIEAGVARVFAGYVTASDGSGILPPGWSGGKSGTGVFVITHGLGTGSYAAVATGVGPVSRITIESASTNVVTFRVYNEAGALADYPFMFVLVLL